MHDFEATVRTAVGENGREKQKIPGVVVAAANAFGMFGFFRQ
jgi:hypothetical protein